MILVRFILKLAVFCAMVFCFLVIFQYGWDDFSAAAMKEAEWIRGLVNFPPAAPEVPVPASGAS